MSKGRPKTGNEKAPDYGRRSNVLKIERMHWPMIRGGAPEATRTIASAVTAAVIMSVPQVFADCDDIDMVVDDGERDELIAPHIVMLARDTVQVGTSRVEADSVLTHEAVGTDEGAGYAVVAFEEFYSTVYGAHWGNSGLVIFRQRLTLRRRGAPFRPIQCLRRLSASACRSADQTRRSQ